MEKRSFDKWDSFIAEEEVEEISQVEPSGVWLQSNYPDKLIVIGSITGTRYEFPKSGSQLLVDERDVPEMLLKKFGGNSCCGSGAKPIPKLVVVE